MSVDGSDLKELTFPQVNQEDTAMIGTLKTVFFMSYVGAVALIVLLLLFLQPLHEASSRT